jgi:hypothetical protein
MKTLQKVIDVDHSLRCRQWGKEVGTSCTPEKDYTKLCELMYLTTPSNELAFDCASMQKAYTYEYLILQINLRSKF